MVIWVVVFFSWSALPRQTRVSAWTPWMEIIFFSSLIHFFSFTCRGLNSFWLESKSPTHPENIIRVCDKTVCCSFLTFLSLVIKHNLPEMDIVHSIPIVSDNTPFLIDISRESPGNESSNWKILFCLSDGNQWTVVSPSLFMHSDTFRSAESQIRLSFSQV